uniref:poly(A)-specific ribonuclease n=21 Tax=Amniota TaxID=32524 RepID=A0A669P5V3_PHACC
MRRRRRPYREETASSWPRRGPTGGRTPAEPRQGLLARTRASPPPPLALLPRPRASRVIAARRSVREGGRGEEGAGRSRRRLAALRAAAREGGGAAGEPPTMPAATVDHSQRICEVWACNLDEEMKKIRQVIRKYNYVAMDTEFPGVVARPIGEFRSNADYQYQLLRCNVDLLKIIQLGLTFMNEQGEYPPGTSTWQFNFKFNLTEDMYAQDSIELLTTSGIQFKKHEEEGIETQYFAELLMTSGVVLCEGVKWLSFHSGYDFGYLIKILTNSNLPEEELDFFEILRLFFPVIYDVKYLMKSCKNLKGGLQEVAEQLELERIGPQHQAGSDSLLTGMAFFKMRENFFCRVAAGARVFSE